MLPMLGKKFAFGVVSKREGKREAQQYVDAMDQDVKCRPKSEQCCVFRSWIPIVSIDDDGEDNDALG